MQRLGRHGKSKKKILESPPYKVTRTFEVKCMQNYHSLIKSSSLK